MLGRQLSHQDLLVRGGHAAIAIFAPLYLGAVDAGHAPPPAPQPAALTFGPPHAVLWRWAHALK